MFSWFFPYVEELSKKHQNQREKHEIYTLTQPIKLVIMRFSAHWVLVSSQVSITRNSKCHNSTQINVINENQYCFPDNNLISPIYVKINFLNLYFHRCFWLTDSVKGRDKFGTTLKPTKIPQVQFDSYRNVVVIESNRVPCTNRTGFLARIEQGSLHRVPCTNRTAADNRFRQLRREIVYL